MTRPLVAGNGNILVTFGPNLSMRDFYYPYVGQWNHIMGYRNRMGFWVEGKFSWLNEPAWQKHPGYMEDSLIALTPARHEGLEIELESRDGVHYHDNIYLKRLKVKNCAARKREIRVFFTQDFSIDETEVGDTALYDPQTHTIYHYKKNRYFMVNGLCGQNRFDMFATGIKRFAGAEGTWRDAEDGDLTGNPIAQGSVDSTIGFKLCLAAGEEKEIFYWIAAGHNLQEVRQLNSQVLQNGPENLLYRIDAYWRHWLARVPADFADLPPRVAEIYRRSLLIIRTHVDHHGAIIAAADSDIMQTNRDHYCYLWPRDGALVARALIRAGYGHMVKEFFAFCANVLTDGGYLLHKYNPDGTVGSSWHPWLKGRQLPIQEDETALVLLALWEYYQYYQDLEFAHDYYRSLVRPMADFMSGYIDDQLNLPLESYDLWEERWGIFTFTAAAVYGSLTVAAAFADLFCEFGRANGYRARAEQIKTGVEEHFYSHKLGRFVRGLISESKDVDLRRSNEQGELVEREDWNLRRDDTLESSTMGVFLFGLLPAGDPRVKATVRAIEQGLWIKTGIGGLARYKNDYYFRRSDDIERIPGNPWIISTLWLARWYIAVAGAVDELKPALALIHWAAVYALDTGVMPEQVHPETGEPLSVAPLTWSHGSFVIAVVEYLEKYRELTGDVCAVIDNPVNRQVY
ncbi:glycoside hydrolase family 15 protein [Desulfotomaculum copahuensis]|uniref:Glycoside hydrolase family 15 n=1 Tax=Desulfotomaculum copahuensis TaxID=1838280 RepID=A0A1B7LEZ7_9FIRM|nr:glycoside hydrolase family 15 protein [Desulfotomaculum copahuensis]OAT81854.1 glycoside hydrolase family 15 [Desulfotomaculum copahuensis]